VKLLLNVKIRVHGNVENFQNNKLLVMSNHYEGLIDGPIIHGLYHKHNSIEALYTIAKSDILGNSKDDRSLLQLLFFIKTAIMNSLYFISYKRGDKEDGNNVKNLIVDHTNNGKNILVFPEGTTRRDGVPREFKTGIFKLAIENKMRILPITLKYNKDIGTEKGEPTNFSSIFNNEVDVYIHDLIDENDECYNDYLAVKQKTFDMISKPFQ
jgi:1-acyl-sn-glycerol-3-phosphate acyltransferase